MSTAQWTAIATNLGGVVETAELSSHPYRVDTHGHPYVPIGDGGIVLGVRLGDSVFATDADHAAPGACLIHPEEAPRHALTSYACLGNPVTVRSGAAAGERGVVLGKRGELGRVIACFAPDVLERLTPTERVVVRGFGQGARLPGPVGERVVLRNTAPDGLELLPVEVTAEAVIASVRASIPSHTIGNGIGRPVEQWDLDIQVDASIAASVGLADTRLGDLVAVDDLDVRHNAGYRRGYRTVGIIVHGASPQPGHGPGLMPILCGPSDALTAQVDARHRPLTEEALLAHGQR